MDGANEEPYREKPQVNIGSGNGLLPDGTKPLPEPMLTDQSIQRLIFQVLFYYHGLTELMIWIYNTLRSFTWDAIAHP